MSAFTLTAFAVALAVICIIGIDIWYERERARIRRSRALIRRVGWYTSASRWHTLSSLLASERPETLESASEKIARAMQVGPR